MTVSYTADVANASGFGCFTKILLRWKGSVYKLIFKELAAYIILYSLLNILYRHVLCDPETDVYYRHIFESLKAYCSIQMSSIPMTFGLGFYVSLIVKRWWDQYCLLPWPDSLAIFVVGLLRGKDEEGRLMRRSIMRYVLLSYVIVLRRVSFRVRKRFPTLDHLVELGVMQEDELKLFESFAEKCSVSKWWMPLVWATNIVDHARQQSKINNDPGTQTILNEISAIRKGLTGVQYYDTLSVPLVYTQVVTLAVYTYFGAALMGAQWVTPSDPKDYTMMYKLPSFSASFNASSEDEFSRFGSSGYGYQPLDMYAPVFLIMQFIFYVGWLKVAETLINPFGEDDDDFELNYLIDRHLKVSMMIVDEMHQDHPTLLKDMYWNKEVPEKLPYTKETEQYRKEEPKGSAEVKEEADNLSSTYYKLTFPFRASVKHSRKAGEHEQHSSEYESIDPNIFNRMKAKIRKSQMRKNGHIHHGDAQLEDGNTIYYIPRRKMSVDQKSTKSFKSQRSIYAKMFGSRFKRRNSAQLVLPVGNELVLPHEGEEEYKSQLEKDLEETRRKVSSISSVSSKNLYGRLASLKDEEEHLAENMITEGMTDVEKEKVMEKIKNLSQLTTITEQNSPYSTNPGTRRNSTRYISAEKVFAQGPKVQKDFSLLHASMDIPHESDHAYYPLGSEGSSHRPVSPRFTVEEVPNYEPILISRSAPTSKTPTLASLVLAKQLQSITTTPLMMSGVDGKPQQNGSPALPKRPLSLSSSPFRTRSPLAKKDSNDSDKSIGISKEAVKDSPALPRRHPVMSLDTIQTKTILTPTSSVEAELVMSPEPKR